MTKVVVYPCYFKIRLSANRERVNTKTLIDENSYSIFEINNAGDDPLSACPQGAMLENQSCVAILDKGMTIIRVSRLGLNS
jgi:hypothetical protein